MILVDYDRLNLHYLSGCLFDLQGSLDRFHDRMIMCFLKAFLWSFDNRVS